MKKKNFLLILFLGLSLSLFGGCKIGDNFFNDGNDTPTVSEKDQKYDVYLMAVEEGLTSLTYEDWLDTIKGEIGPEGPAGKKLLLNISSTHIQYKYEGDLTWTNLISLNKLKGEDGTDGREVKFCTTDTAIRWKYEDYNYIKKCDEWNFLISFNELKGEAGKDGKDGATWHTGEGEPLYNPNIHNDGDLYLDSKTGIIYECNVVYWTKVIDLTEIKKEKNNC